MIEIIRGIITADTTDNNERWIAIDVTAQFGRQIPDGYTRWTVMVPLDAPDLEIGQEVSLHLLPAEKVEA